MLFYAMKVRTRVTGAVQPFAHDVRPAFCLASTIRLECRLISTCREHRPSRATTFRVPNMSIQARSNVPPLFQIALHIDDDHRCLRVSIVRTPCVAPRSSQADGRHLSVSRTKPGRCRARLLHLSTSISRRVIVAIVRSSSSVGVNALSACVCYAADSRSTSQPVVTSPAGSHERPCQEFRSYSTPTFDAISLDRRDRRLRYTRQLRQIILARSKPRRTRTESPIETSIRFVALR